MEIERARLIAAQKRDVYFAPIIVAVEAAQSGKDVQSKVRQLLAMNSDLERGRNPSTITRESVNYEIVEGLLYRRVYSVSDDEVQLRCCVPAEGLGAMEFPGYGKIKLNMRERLLLEYHNSPLGGHLGREKTCLLYTSPSPRD